VSHYIAFIHKEPGSIYGASFPDVPGVTAAADSLDAVILQAAEVLSFAAQDWEDLRHEPFPRPRTIDQIRDDPECLRDIRDAIVAAIPMTALANAA
jgi:predicted RNase H-like HicB family nuclease